MTNDQNLIDQLDSFLAPQRQAALLELLTRHPEAPAETTCVNMHMHSFFSFNGEGWSPSHLAWNARQDGLYAMALCDFDVLAGLHETLAAADLLRLRAAVSFESRVFFSEYADSEINSPGEPGVFYFMGCGFTQPPEKESKAEETLAAMLNQSHRRNRDLIDRVNSKLSGLDLDYERDVLPLTPAQNATERHIVRGYYEKARDAHSADTKAAAAWWAKQFGMEPDSLQEKAGDVNEFVDALRSKLMKQGGLGYAQPTRDTFPPLDDVIQMILECRAIPTSAWLDGTSEGESNPREQLECLADKGVAAVNIIPDRNWNVKDKDKRAKLVTELNRYVETASDMNLPIFVGTELNKPGQRFIDDFDAEPMKPHHAAFMQGAQVLIGHTRLLRWADVSLVDEDTRSEWPDAAERNQVFAAVGALQPPDRKALDKLEEMTPEKALQTLMDAANAGEWA